MNQPIPIPVELKPFKPHGTSFATIEDGAGSVFYAVLGSVGGNKATFHVWVWVERPDGALALISIDDPPNNAPTFAVVDGVLKLYGVLESPPTVYTAVERDVPGYVAPPVPLTMAEIMTFFCRQLLENPASNIAAAVRKCVGGWLMK